MRRRDVIKMIAASAAGLPLAARAQQSERTRRVGILMALAATDAEGHARLAAFLQGLQEYGWTVGRNMRVDIRWAAGNADDIRKYAAELIALSPDVILVSGGTAVGPLLQLTRTVPVVFTQTFDPVSGGFVASLARPGGNATGFTGETGVGGRRGELPGPRGGRGPQSRHLAPAGRHSCLYAGDLQDHGTVALRPARPCRLAGFPTQ